MNIFKKAIYGLTLLAFTSGSLFAQTNNRVSAHDAFMDFMKLQKDNPTAAKGKLLEAKKYIDLAAEHPETKNDPKTLTYKGKIYFFVAALAGAKDAQFAEFDPNKMGEAAIQSFKEAMKYKTKKYDPKDDIHQFLMLPYTMSYQAGSEYFKKQKYDTAMVSFGTCYELMNIIEVLDTLSCFNAGLSAEYHADRIANKCAADKKDDCPEAKMFYDSAANYYAVCAQAGFNGADMYVRYTDVLLKGGNKDKAKEALLAGKAKYPKDNSLIIQEFNYYLSIGDNASAEKALSEAIKANPKDAILYFNAGAIYSEMKRYDEAKKAYESAIAIEPKYFDAYFNLGAMYFNQAADLYNAINDIKDNAVYDKEKARADQMFKDALPWLEKARELNGKDKNNLIMLRTIYARLSMNDKWKEVDQVIKNG